MIDLKLDKRRFKNHMEYSKWLYIGVIAGACLLFGIVYSVTEPKVPDEYRVDILVDGNILYQTSADRWSAEMLERLPEDQQLVTIYGMSFEALGYQTMELLMARMTVGEDEIYILPYDTYRGFAAQQAFYDLTDIADQFQYQLPPDREIEDYYVQTEDFEGELTEARLYGLPVDGAHGLLYDLGIDPTGKVLCIFSNNKNLDNAIECAKYILEQNSEQ